MLVHAHAESETHLEVDELGAATWTIMCAAGTHETLAPGTGPGRNYPATAFAEFPGGPSVQRF